LDKLAIDAVLVVDEEAAEYLSDSYPNDSAQVKLVALVLLQELLLIILLLL
jgi:hypothetical protein